jgi:Amt family ammonium transporter
MAYCFNPDAVTQVCIDAVTGLATVTTIADESGIGIETDVDVMWVLIAGILVFWMQAGFAMLEAGCVSEKNVQNILYKNLMDACIGALMFFAFGYAFAYGDGNDGSFIGTANFFLMAEDGTTYHSFFFQWAFAATAATIVSGSVAERTKLSAYFVYSIFLTIFVYPVVVHWVWDSEGWLCAWKTDGLKFISGSEASNGFIDFAGSGVVHMVGGFSGLMGAVFVGPRLGCFEPVKDKDGNDIVHKAHSKLLASLGVCILWMGWYGFNAGSTLLVSGGTSFVASKVCVTTTLAAASGAITCTVFARIFYKNYDLMLTLNGVLAGLVSITASCSVVEPWAAIVAGIIGALIFIGTSALLKKMKIDDPLDACPIHGFCGFWGCLCSGIFATDANILATYGNDTLAVASGEQFLVQLLGSLCIVAWTLVTSGFLFFVMKKTMGLRVPEFVEREGLDLSEHGGSAYESKQMVNLLGGKEGSVSDGAAHKGKVQPAEP